MVHVKVNNGNSINSVFGARMPSRYRNIIEKAKNEGGNILVEGGVLSGKGYESGCYVKPVIIEAENDYNLMCTYNISVEENYSELENTILLHRKKQTNTLYTINALNALITVLNNGVLDTTYQLDWELYRNTMLLTNEEGLKRIDTEVEDIIYIKVKR